MLNRFWWWEHQGAAAVVPSPTVRARTELWLDTGVWEGSRRSRRLTLRAG